MSEAELSAARLALGPGRPSPRRLVQFAFGLLITLVGMAVIVGELVSTLAAAFSANAVFRPMFVATLPTAAA